jgi:hypothetical protein
MMCEFSDCFGSAPHSVNPRWLVRATSISQRIRSVRAAAHRGFQQSDPVDIAFDGSGVVVHGQPGNDGIQGRGPGRRG